MRAKKEKERERGKNEKICVRKFDLIYEPRESTYVHCMIDGFSNIELFISRLENFAIPAWRHVCVSG